MADNYEEVLINLKEKIASLISKYEYSKQEKIKLFGENVELKKQLKTTTSDLDELNQKYETLKIAKTVMGTEDFSHDAKIKVNRIVREIDKCIALLNR